MTLYSVTEIQLLVMVVIGILPGIIIGKFLDPYFRVRMMRTFNFRRAIIRIHTPAGDVIPKVVNDSGLEAKAGNLAFFLPKDAPVEQERRAPVYDFLETDAVSGQWGIFPNREVVPEGQPAKEGIGIAGRPVYHLGKIIKRSSEQVSPNQLSPTMDMIESNLKARLINQNIKKITIFIGIILLLSLVAAVTGFLGYQQGGDTLTLLKHLVGVK